MLTFYKFMSIADPEGLVERLRPRLQAHAALGTVLLSREGVNGSLGVEPTFKASLMEILRSPEFFGELTFKENQAKTQPFRRLNVRVKKEIITFRVPNLDPLHEPAPYVAPEELKEWYDNGKDMVVIDTRNEFEVKFGAFKDAKSYNMVNFTEFANIARTFPEEFKKKTVVTYCTGGIRCEKAAPFLKNLGFEDVYQLEGGILNYFERVGGDHWNGECFVFDNRVAVNPKLEETTTSFCNMCQAPIYDARIKKLFDETERYCEACYPQIPKNLLPRWNEFWNE